MFNRIGDVPAVPDAPSAPLVKKPARRASGLVRAAVAVVAVAIGLLAVPGAASAGTANCPRGYFCAWQHSSFNGERFKWSGYDGYWANNTSNGVNINNNSSSWQNSGITGPGIPSYVRVYDGFYGTGDYLICLPPNTQLSYNGAVNDRPSSHYWKYSC